MIRRWLVRVLAIGLGLGLLVALEGGVRLAGWARLPPPLPPSAPTADADGRFFTSSGLPRYLEPAPPGPDGRPRIRTSREAVRRGILLDLSFDAQPAAGTPRIVALGGSATMGVPNEDRPQLSFPSRLEYHLRQAGLSAEVINLGGASLGSAQVLEIAAEVAEYRPSAFVIYSGNNEFFQYHLRLLEANQHGIVLRSQLDRLHLARLLRRGYRRIRGLPAEAGGPLTAVDARALAARQDELVASLVDRSLALMGAAATPAFTDGGPITRQDPGARSVVAEYAANLGAVADLAAGMHPPALVVAVTVPANLLHPPALSLHRPDLGPLGRWRVERALASAAAATTLGDPQGAEAAATDALALDPLYARAHFVRGQARLAAGEREAARRDLLNAVEVDFNPGRPVEALREVVRGLASRGAVVVDGEAALTPPARLGAGRSPFTDACHLTPAANDTLALAIAVDLASAWLSRPPP